MPTSIVFGGFVKSPGPGDTWGVDAITVVQDPEAVARELGESQTGFAPFQAQSDPAKTVWVNRALVRFLRDAGERER